MPGGHCRDRIKGALPTALRSIIQATSQHLVVGTIGRCPLMRREQDAGRDFSVAAKRRDSHTKEA